MIIIVLALSVSYIQLQLWGFLNTLMQCICFLRGIFTLFYIHGFSSMKVIFNLKSDLQLTADILEKFSTWSTWEDTNYRV